ncbi:MAG: lipase family protein [Novosphingobium sp.]
MLSRLASVFAIFLLAAIMPPALAQPAGTLVSADPILDPPPDMQAWKVRYRTTAQDGALREATGIVAAPRGAPPQRPRRVVAWTHGAWGVAEKCGPSLAPNFLSISPALGEMVGRGYVVVAPDYPGLASGGQHGFLVGRETAQSVLDAVRAARSIPGAAAGSSFAVWGESQGGHAALWTASEARRYAPDLTLVGTAAAAPPTDLAENLRQGSNANIRAMLTSFAVYSWSQRFGAPLSTLVNRTNAGVVTRLAQNNCVTLDAKPKLGTALGVLSVRTALKNKDLGTIQPWARIARDNSVAPRSVPGPLMIAQSQVDAVVAPTVTLAFARRYCALGRPLRYLRLTSTPHEHSARDSASATLDWIAARFEGGREVNDCRGL